MLLLLLMLLLFGFGSPGLGLEALASYFLILRCLGLACGIIACKCWITSGAVLGVSIKF
jgi:hypothetical protein